MRELRKMLRHLKILILVILLVFGPFITLSNTRIALVKAQGAEIGTLAYTLNSRLKNITWTLENLSPLIQGIQYGIIFKQFNSSIYDDAANSLLNSHDWLDIIKLKRIAEVSGYDSATLDNALRQALENIPMAGALPVTSPDGSYSNYDRFVLYGYKYAEQMGISRWNKQAAFQQLANLVNQSGGLGFLTATANSTSGSARYYDEQAETISDFLIFNEIGVTGAKAYATEIWDNLLNEGWWDSKDGVFLYLNGTTTLECEMGGFALITSRYLGYVPQEVLSDINQKLLAKGWDSVCWKGLQIYPHGSSIVDSYVLIHAISLYGTPVNRQPRPWETCTVWRALQALYPGMNSSMRSNMTSMLSQNGWQSTLNSGDFDLDTSTQLSGIMTAFLMGIIPKTASLNTGFDDESSPQIGNDIEFPSNEYSFDYTNNQITIPVKGSGELDFIFGTNMTSAYFPKTGVYNVTFSSDWNTVIKISLSSSGSCFNFLNFIEISLVSVLIVIVIVLCYFFKHRK